MLVWIYLQDDKFKVAEEIHRYFEIMVVLDWNFYELVWIYLQQDKYKATKKIYVYQKKEKCTMRHYNTYFHVCLNLNV